MTKEIITELDQIESFLMVTPSQDPEEIKERLCVVAVYNTRLGSLLADAKKILRTSKASEICETVINIAKERFLSAKAQNALIDSICVEEQFMVDRIERLQRSCVRDIEANRSVLSYLKQELNNLGLHEG
jgi:hypothetical protein